VSTWQPVSGCGPECRAGGDDAVSDARAVLRVVTLCAVLLIGLVLVPVFRGPAVRPIARALLAALGVRLCGRGPAPRPGSLLVANHVSWLDIVALLALGPARLVAKREVRGWPGIGMLAALSGAIFVDRALPRALPETVGEVAAALRAGRSVAAFPEGTTFCGVGARSAGRPEEPGHKGRFRPAVFQAAVDASAPVVPIAISYCSTAAAFIGDDSLWSSVLRVARLRDLTVTLVGSPALHPEQGASRRVLARAAEASVALTPSALGLAA
jgi:1-acyl-sn-glycerol-3-phosphate acyltransferase